MSKKAPKPVEIELDAPERLLNCMRAIGYDCKLRIIRREVAEVDPDSDPGPVDAKITATDKNQIEATLRAYEASSKHDKGERFEPPADEDEDE